MEIETKFVLSSEDEFYKILDLLENMGFRCSRKRNKSFWDIYLKTIDKREAVRYRIYDKKIVRTYKREISKEGGVIKRVEEEREVSSEEFEEERKERGTILETYTKRREYDYGNFKICFDSVIFHGKINMLFLEVEGEEESVRKISKILSDKGFKIEERSKLEIGLSLSPHL